MSHSTLPACLFAALLLMAGGLRPALAAPTSAPATAPAAAMSVTTEPATAAAAYHAYLTAGLAGDRTVVLNMLIPDAGARRLAVAALDRAAAQHAFEHALVAQFGAAGQRVIPPEAALPAVTTAPAPTGDATAILVQGRTVALARKIRGHWKIDPRLTTDANSVGQAVELNQALRNAAVEQTKAVEKGQYPTAEAAAHAFRAAWQACLAAQEKKNAEASHAAQ